MNTRTRRTALQEEDGVHESRRGLDLDSVSDDEIESLLFSEEEKPAKSPVNLPTIAGLSLVTVGVVYLLQEMGLWNGFDLSPLVSMLPWLAGILIILLGFGVLGWRDGAKKPKRRSKSKPRFESSVGQSSYGGATVYGGKKRLVKSRNKKVSGVAGGVAEYFNVDPTVVRIAFVISVFVTQGASLLAYFALSYVMPKPDALTFEERITILRDS